MFLECPSRRDGRWLNLARARFLSYFQELKMAKVKASSSVTAEDVLHEIRVKLYPNTLPNVEGKYVARTYNRKGLNLEDLCTTLKRRTKYEGDYNEALKVGKAIIDEAAYQLCDGHMVNLGYFSIYPNIGGTFDTQRDKYDREKNPVSFRFRTLAKLRRLASLINVEIEGLADSEGLIDTFIDGSSQTTNKYISGGSIFTITGEKIKVFDDGVNEDCGVFFVKADDPSVRRKVTSYLAENSPTKIIGVTPVLIGPADYRVEIVTQFTSGSNFLKTPRTIVSKFELKLT